MPRRVIRIEGVEWGVALSGRLTPYAKDEVGLVFTRLGGTTDERRAVRFSPRRSKSREEAFAELDEGDLVRLFHTSQPAWTAPELGYDR